MSWTFYPSDEYDSIDLEQERVLRHATQRWRRGPARHWRDDDDDDPSPTPVAAPRPQPLQPLADAVGQAA
jgi:hypothetical protein